MLAFSLPSRDKNQLLLILRCKFTKSAENLLTLQAKFALLIQESGEYQLSSLRELAYDRPDYCIQ